MDPLRRDLWSTRLNSVQPLLVELIGLGDFPCARTSSAIRGTTLRAPAVYACTSDCASDHRRRRRVLARNRVQAPWLPSLCARWLPGPRSRPAFLLAPTRALEAGRLQVRRNSSPLRSTARRGRRDTPDAISPASFSMSVRRVRAHERGSSRPRARAAPAIPESPDDVRPRHLVLFFLIRAALAGAGRAPTAI